LLGTVTVYVGAGVAELDIDVRGYLAGVERSEGAVHVTMQAGKQVPATVVLARAARDDVDGGVPSDGGAEDTAAPEDGGAPEGGAGPDTESDAGAGGGCAGSSLAGVVAVPSSPVDLTAEGVLDWRHWGQSGFVDVKASAGDLIGDYTLIGTTATSTVMRMSFSWSDGSPRGTVSDAPAAIAVMGAGTGFELDVPAAASSQTLSVYVSGENDSATFTASLSDGCVADYTVSRTDTDVYVAVYRMAFRSTVAGARLHVTWKMTAGAGPIGLHAATLY
jgi:hypothetical protein